MWRTLLRSDRKARTSARASMGRVRTSGCSWEGCDLRIKPRRTRAKVTASSMARRGEAGARAWRWKGKLCLIGALDWTGSTSKAAQILDSIEGPKGSDSGWCCCHRWYSVRRSKVRECWRYGGRTTALSRASRGNWTRRSQASRVTKTKSRFWEVKCSFANVSNRLMASRKVPALRTCSQVRVVKLAKDANVSWRIFNLSSPLQERGVVWRDGNKIRSQASCNYLLHNGVIGVLMGLTRTLSRVIWKTLRVSQRFSDGGSG